MTHKIKRPGRLREASTSPQRIKKSYLDVSRKTVGQHVSVKKRPWRIPKAPWQTLQKPPNTSPAPPPHPQNMGFRVQGSSLPDTAQRPDYKACTHVPST